MKEKALKLLAGAGDVHVHTSPSLIPGRRSDIWTLIRACEEKKMAFVVVKWHHGDSYSAARVVNQLHEGPCRLYGGLVLNQPVGGLNPFAVDCAVTLKAKIVWLPTLDAAGHEKAIGQLGGFPFQPVERAVMPVKGLRILDAEDNLLPEVKEILAILNGTETVLATGHISAREIHALSGYLQQEKLKIHLLINHIDFSVPDLAIDDVEALTSDNTWFELAYFTLSKLGHSSIQTVLNLLTRNPGAQFILASDSGQAENPISPDAMLRFIWLLLENRLSEQQIDTLLHRNTRNLLML